MIPLLIIAYLVLALVAALYFKINFWAHHGFIYWLALWWLVVAIVFVEEMIWRKSNPSSDIRPPTSE